MKKIIVYIVMLGTITFFTGCDFDPETTGSYYTDESASEPSSIQTKEKMVCCPSCGGTGIWGDPTDFMAKFPCGYCNTTGMVTESQAREIINAYGQMQQMSGGYTYPNSGYSQSSNNGRRQCYDCNGSGKCSRCGGRGEHKAYNTYDGSVMEYDCEYCHGSGHCQTCYGSGTV